MGWLGLSRQRSTAIRRLLRSGLRRSWVLPMRICATSSAGAVPTALSLTADSHAIPGAYKMRCQSGETYYRGYARVVKAARLNCQGERDNHKTVVSKT